MPDRITAKTGQAPVKKLGHTSMNQYGQDNTVKVKGRRVNDNKTA